jgi:alpha-beta hydrolase superfamily lysophospholipase
LQREHGNNLILTGHSLGGGLAAYASMRNGGIAATGVNSAPLNGVTLLSGALGNRGTQNITHYNAREFVSRSPGVQPGQRINVPSRNGGIGGFFSNHALGNTAPDVPLPTRVR